MVDRCRIRRWPDAVLVVRRRSAPRHDLHGHVSVAPDVRGRPTLVLPPPKAERRPGWARWPLTWHQDGGQRQIRGAEPPATYGTRSAPGRTQPRRAVPSSALRLWTMMRNVRRVLRATVHTPRGTRSVW